MEALPHSEGWVLLTIVHLAATGAMVGLMWTIHFVHYPLFALVGPARYGEFQTEHMRRITWVLVLPWGVESLTALALVVAAPGGGLQALAVAGLVLTGAVVALTALLAAPAHGRLRGGFDDGLHRQLLRVDGVRTAVWTTRLIVAAAIVWRTAT